MDEPILNVVGERVALGPRRRDLVPTYLRWINDFSALRTLGALPPQPTSLEQEFAWYDALPASEVHFTIYERSTSRPIGSTALRNIDHRNRSATFGILIGEPEARGQGYGTEATQLTLDYAFTALGLHNVLLTVAEFNLAGQRAYARAGFREIGRRRQCRWLAGRLWDEVSMDCLASEFHSPVLARIFVPDVPRDDASQAARPRERGLGQD